MKDYIHKEFPKSCDPNDFFGQVKRTVNGKPVGPEQINMIINAIVNGLELKKEDVLFDLGCGNGALSVLMFNSISKYVGIDFSEYLVEIAKKNFEKEGYRFYCAEAAEYLNRAVPDPEFTKGLCYGVFSYFEKEAARGMLGNLHSKFTGISHFYIGNIPDRDRADRFFYKDIDYSKMIDDPQSSIGIWWTQDEITRLAAETGWKVKFHQMPENYYSAHYRFDAILVRK
jgi:cyclopropane fatty-acyl-phospholipid synthase-like methyltransferase